MPNANDAKLNIEISGVDLAIEKAKELNSLLEQAKKLSVEIASQASGRHVSVK